MRGKGLRLCQNGSRQVVRYKVPALAKETEGLECNQKGTPRTEHCQDGD